MAGEINLKMTNFCKELRWPALSSLLFTMVVTLFALEERARLRDCWVLTKNDKRLHQRAFTLRKKSVVRKVMVAREVHEERERSRRVMVDMVRPICVNEGFAEKRCAGCVECERMEEGRRGKEEGEG